MTATTPTPLEVLVPSQDEKSEENRADQSLDGQLSPTSLRRSTRTCALKAQEKLKVKEMVALDMTTVDCSPMSTLLDQALQRTETPTAEEDGAQTSETVQDGEIPKKRRKLTSGAGLDQYDCKFGIRLDANDDVVMMTDESDISSLNSEEVAELRDKYKLTKEQEATMSAEIQRQREIQVHEMESALRLEEAKLTMLKKLRANQQLAHKAIQQHEAQKKFSSVVNQNSLGTAYKPTIAAPANKVNGVNRTNKAAKPASGSGSISLTPQQQQILQRIVTQSGGNPQQMAQLLRSLNPSALAALQQTVQAQQEAAKQQQQQQQQQQTAQAASAKQSAADAARIAKETALASQQRINAARQQLRLHLENQLKQVPLPKAPAQDLSFIPNGTQPDFCYLLGLDLCVQRVLKDKSVHKKVDVEPYVCEECGSDFTPVWKAIAGDKGDLHLYCELCVRQAQKRKIRQDQMSMVRKAFGKMQEQEKEFERQVSSGKFGDPNPPARPAAPATPPVTAAKPSVSANASPAAAVKTESSTMSAASTHTKSPSVSTANATSRGPANASTPKAAKRASNATNAMNALSALTSSNPALQQQLAVAQQLRNNPVLATMMISNPALMSQFQQMWMQMLAQNQTSAARPAQNNQNQAMNMLQALAQMQNSTSTANASSNSNSNNSAMSQLLAAFTAQQNAALMGSLGGNNTGAQQLLRAAQLQQLQQQLASAKSKK
ncbi:Protein DCP-66 a [Aphelenchoides avenae]|nr:Protein DCP-66 a [Aphelenchus avenae]